MRSHQSVVSLPLSGVWILYCLVLGGCGGASGGGGGNVGSNPTIMSVAMSCAATTLPVQQTTQCSAEVQGTGSYSKAVNWSVNSVSGGNDTVGTISATGLYVAPDPIPSIGSTMTISAVSQEDSSKSASAAISLVYPAPTLTGISPASASIGSSGTQIVISGSNFSKASVAIFNGQSLTTTFTSAAQLSATIPGDDLSSPGAASVAVMTPTPGGGSSSAAQFTISPSTAASSLVILATPAYSGAQTGPWVLSVTGTDSSGNLIPNLPISLQATEGSVTPASGFTNTQGIFSASVSPPDSYAGDAVAIVATSGSQTAAVNIAFVATSGSLEQNAAVLLKRARRKSSTRFSVSGSSNPLDSGTSNTNIVPMMIGTSAAPGTTNPFLTPNMCYSNAQLDTTVPVDCQTVFSTSQVHLSPSDFSTTACTVVGDIIGGASCAGTAGILVACALPESGVGAVVCAGGVGVVGDLGQECAGFLANEVVQYLAGSNKLKGVAGETEVDIVGLLQGADPADLVGVACNAIDAASLGVGNGITVTPGTATVPLGGTVTFSADSAVNWSVMGNNGGSSFGTISNGVYAAPSTFPISCAVLDGSGSCPVTVTATSVSNGFASWSVVDTIGGSGFEASGESVRGSRTM